MLHNTFFSVFFLKNANNHLKKENWTILCLIFSRIVNKVKTRPKYHK